MDDGQLIYLAILNDPVFVDELAKLRELEDRIFRSLGIAGWAIDGCGLTEAELARAQSSLTTPQATSGSRRGS